MSVSLARLLTRVLLGSALLVLAGGALLWTARRPAFDFRRIEVRGDLRHVSHSAVRAAIAGRLAGNFFTLRLADARAAFDSIPWVAAANVRRLWPDTLVVEIVERRAVGLWSDGRVLSDAGALFDANPAEAELDGRLIDFSGPAQLAPLAAASVPALRTELAALPATLAAVEISERASWSVRTAEGPVLDLGRDEPPGAVQHRLAAVVAAYPAVVAQLGGAPAHIDARYTNGFAATKP